MARRSVGGTQWMALAILAVLAALGAAAPAETDDAATWYRSSIDRLEHLRAAMPRSRDRAQQEALAAWLAAPLGPVPDDVRAQLEELRPALRLARRAAEIDSCTFGDSTAAYAPYLSALAELVVTDGMARFEAGDASGGAACVRDGLRIADHVVADPTIIGALFARDIARQAIGAARWATDRGLVPPNEARAIVDALDRIDPANPFRVVEAIGFESSDELARYRGLAETEGVARVVTELGDHVRDPVAQAALAMMDEAQLAESLAAAEAYAARLVDALAIADLERARLEVLRLENENRRGEHGVVARALMRDEASIWERMIESAHEAAACAVQLSAIASGRVAPADGANAAVWYLRAIESMRAVDPEARLALVAHADDPVQPIAPALVAVVGASGEALELVKVGAALDRCDFWPVRLDHPVGVAPYHADVRELESLLLVAARRAFDANDLDVAVERLVLALRLAGHLGQDRSLASSLIAHDVFRRVYDVVEPWLRADQFTVTHRRDLVRAAREASYRDPFGFEAAAAQERRALGRWLAMRWERLPVPVVLQMETALERCDDDQLLFLALSAGVIEQPERGETGPMDSARRLGGLLSRNSLDAAGAQIARVQSILEQERVTALDERLAPRFGRAADRHRDARDAVRTMLVALRGDGLLDESIE